MTEPRTETVNLTANTTKTCIILTVEGRIDALTSPAFEAEIVRQVDGGARRLLLDFAGCDFINSNGLRILLVARKRLLVDGTVAICRLHSNVATVFHIAGFTTLFPIYESIDEALGAMERLGAGEG
jgi:anti-anti-sigma factor